MARVIFEQGEMRIFDERTDFTSRGYYSTTVPLGTNSFDFLDLDAFLIAVLIFFLTTFLALDDLDKTKNEITDMDYDLQAARKKIYRTVPQKYRGYCADRVSASADEDEAANHPLRPIPPLSHFSDVSLRRRNISAECRSSGFGWKRCSAGRGCGPVPHSQSSRTRTHPHCRCRPR